MAVANYPVFDPGTGEYYDAATGQTVGPPTGMPIGGGDPGAAPETQAQYAVPSDVATSTPTGLPTPGQVNNMAPRSLADFGATPTVTPTYANSAGYNAALVDPNKTPQYLQQEEDANRASLQPQFREQQQANQDQLAARGI